MEEVWWQAGSFFPAQAWYRDKVAGIETQADIN